MKKYILICIIITLLLLIYTGCDLTDKNPEQSSQESMSGVVFSINNTLYSSSNAINEADYSTYYALWLDDFLGDYENIVGKYTTESGSNNVKSILVTGYFGDTTTDGKAEFYIAKSDTKYYFVLCNIMYKSYKDNDTDEYVYLSSDSFAIELNKTNISDFEIDLPFNTINNGDLIHIYLNKSFKAIKYHPDDTSEDVVISNISLNFKAQKKVNIAFVIVASGDQSGDTTLSIGANFSEAMDTSITDLYINNVKVNGEWDIDSQALSYIVADPDSLPDEYYIDIPETHKTVSGISIGSPVCTLITK